MKLCCKLNAHFLRTFKRTLITIKPNVLYDKTLGRFQVRAYKAENQAGHSGSVSFPLSVD